jgi:N-acetylglucosamine kinase-like BadF-type ATPase
VIGLGIDAGGSGSRWLLRDDAGRDLARGEAGPITGHLFTAAEREENLARLASVLQAALAAARPDAVAIGLTGFHRGSAAAPVLLEHLSATLKLPPERIDLDNDMHIAYAAAFAPGQGVLIYAGTGSVGYHETADGEIVRAGGYGYLVDDAGGGFWIGHKALCQVFRWFDETGEPARRPLADHLYEALGSRDWDVVIGTIYGGGRSAVAALAPAVALAAEERDEAAQAILTRAGQELARLARAIFKRLQAVLPVAFTGGVSRLSPLLTAALKEALPTEVAFVTPQITPVEAAAELALRLAKRG